MLPMRAFGLAMAVAGLAIFGYLVWQRDQGKFHGLLPTAPTAQPQTSGPVDKKKLNDCLDMCEQQTIVENSEEALKTCRRNCNGGKDLPRGATVTAEKAGTAGGRAVGRSDDRPYEPIRSITRSPADHRKK